MGASVAGMVAQGGADARRAGLVVPEAEPGQVATARIFHGGDEFLAGRRLAVVPLEIEIGAGAELLLAQDGVHHPDELGALRSEERRVGKECGSTGRARW